jgi:two-component system response regulator
MPIPVVILTSSEGEKKLVNLYRSGTKICTVKPFKGDKFMKAMAGLSIFWIAFNKQAGFCTIIKKVNIKQNVR